MEFVRSVCRSVGSFVGLSVVRLFGSLLGLSDAAAH